MATSQTSLLLSVNSLHHLISIISIKLNMTNYLIWKAQILPLIQSLGVEAHLYNPPPAETIFNNANEAVTNPTYATWKNRDLLLRS